MRHRRLRRTAPGAGDPARGSTEARIPRLRLGGDLDPVRRSARLRAGGGQPEPRCAPPSTQRGSTSTAAASPSPLRRPPPASATRAGPPTGVSARRTPTRTSTPTTACTSWSTGSSRTTWSSSRSCSPAGAEFTSETDVEVMAHLIARELDVTGDLTEAVRRAYNRLRGHYAFVAVAADEPGVIVGARKECPLIVGRGDGEQFLASGIPAFLAHTRQVQYIEDDEIVVVRPEGVEFLTAAGESVDRPIETIDWDAEEAEKGGYETFMLKEIHEQADAVAETIADRTVRPDGVDLPELDDDAAALRPPDRDRGLRHLVPRGPDRPLRDRGMGARARRDGHRVRVPLPQSDRRPRRSGDRHHAVGRDGRHAGGHATRPRARGERARGHEHPGLAGHARQRRRAVHPLRPRDLGRRHQDVHGPGRGHVPAGAADGRGARRDGRRAPARARLADQAPAARDRRAARARFGGSRPRRRAVQGRAVLPLPRPPRRPAGVPRGSAQAQGDLLHGHRRLRRRRDEARPDRAARRGHARGRRGHRLAGARARSCRTCRRCAPAAPP